MSLFRLVLNEQHIPHSDQLTVFQDVDVWTSERIHNRVDVILRSGRIVGIQPTGAFRGTSFGVRILKSNGPERWTLMPSAVDLQVHLRTPGQWHKEAPETGLKAALYGGVGALLTMPNTNPVLDSVEAVELCRSQLRQPAQSMGIECLISVAGTIGQKGKTVAPIRELVQAGARAVTDDGKGIESDQIQLEIFQALEGTGIPFLQHAETLGAQGPLAPGPVPEQLGLAAYDERHEVDMVRRDLELLRKAPEARYHLLHTSSRRSLPLIQKAKAEGLMVTAEVSPHHLFFSSDDIDPENKSFKMNPPIRSRDDRDALVAALADGLIDFVATDHAPHERATKTVPFKTASFGTLGLETLIPVVLTLVQQQKLSPKRAVQVLSVSPARFIGLDSSFGALRLGQIARIAIFDPKSQWTVRAEALKSFSKNTCFDGQALTGKVLGAVNPAGIFTFSRSV